MLAALTDSVRTQTANGESAQKALFCILLKFKDVSRLTVQRKTNCVQRRKADCTDLSGFELGEIDIADADLFAQLVETHFSVRHHAVKP